MNNRAFVVGDVAFKNQAALAHLYPGKAGVAQVIEFLDLPPAVNYRVTWDDESRLITDPVQVNHLSRQVPHARVSVIPVIS